MFKKIKDKKGVALETAIVMILLMYSFATILYIVSYREKVRDNINNFKMNIPCQIEQIGEDFYGACLDDHFETFTYDKGDYKAITSTINNSYVLSVVDKNKDNEVLYVLIDKETKEIKKWVFRNPLYDEINNIQVDSTLTS